MTVKRYQIVLRCQCPGSWQENGLTKEEIASEAGISPELVQRLLEMGLINFRGRMDDPRFSREEIRTIQKIVRLRRDLGINWAGAGLVISMLADMEKMEKEIKYLRHRLERGR